MKEFYPDKSILIHLKIETGMHRLGIEQYEIPEVLQYILKNPKVKVESIFSHLAASDASEFDDFSSQQIQIFNHCYQLFVGGLGYSPLAHILNSAGILRFPNEQKNMVRLGLGLYGLDSSGLVQDSLQLVSTLKATISQIKTVNAGGSIGYNRMGKAKNSLRIATVSIGYADGLPRMAGNGNYSMHVHGQKVPIVGNVCMDMCMIDISDISNVEVGDEVLVFGSQLPITGLAKACETIPYEILTGISSRVKRVYFQE